MRHSIWLLLLLVACDDGGEAEAPVADADDPDGRGLVGDLLVPDAAPPDAAVEPDLGPDTAEPDAGPAPGIQDCSQACARYAECLARDIFPTDEACLSACEMASRDGTPSQWFTCIEETGCDVIEGCVVPAPIQLTCEQACADIEACGLPAAYSDDCAAWCAEKPALVECAEALTAGLCEGAAFRECVAERVEPLCGPYCADAVECNVERADGCVTDCVARLRGDDALARLRTERASQCVAQSMQCLQTQRCADLDAPSGLGRTCIQACEGLQSCEFAPDFDTCLADCDAQLEVDPVGYQFFVDCIVEFVAPAECDPEVFQSCAMLDPAVGPAPCDLYCEALGACGEAPANCAGDCNAALLDPVAAVGWRRVLPCGRKSTCPEFAECAAGRDPEPVCRAVCARLGECGVDGCLESCVDGFDTARVQSQLACAEAGDCDAVRECLPGPPLPCAEHCARLQACQPGAAPNCLATCDDESLRDPDTAADRVACVIAAPVCMSANPFEPEHAVDQCTLNPRAGGERARACLNRCRHLVECEGAGDLGDCAQGCAAGLQGEAALRFVTEEACWAGRPAAPTCADLAECPVEDFAVDCDAHCARVAGCGIPAEACLAECAEPDIDAIACAAFAQGCGAVAECVGFAAPEPDPACAQLCAIQAECDPEVDPFRCELACDGDAPLAARAACAQVTACGGLEDCLAIDAVDPACVEACGECADCAPLCTGRQASARADAANLQSAPACLAEDECADVAACFPVPTACTDACDLLANCQIPLAEDPVACKAVNCPGGRPSGLFERAIICAEQHLRVGCNEDAYLPCLIGIEL